MVSHRSASQEQYSMTTEKLQGLIPLEDQNQSGKLRPWKQKKAATELLACAYDQVDPDKAGRLRDCASQITFSVPEDGGRKTLRAANFCRVRLCPMCAWRRTLKITGQMNMILSAISDNDSGVSYIFTTFTLRNCSADQLADKLSQMSSGWNRLMGYKAIKAATLGAYRGTEITYNREADTYHPHYHVLFAVPELYFKKGDYIDHDGWVRLWRKAMRLDYDPVVDVRKVKGDTAEAVAEVAKYAVKEGDYLDPNDWDMTLQTVITLNGALAKRRFVAFTGVFREWHRKLHLDDAEDGDLIRTDTKDDLEGQALVTYAWNTGLRNYYIRAE